DRCGPRSSKLKCSFGAVSPGYLVGGLRSSSEMPPKAGQGASRSLRGRPTGTNLRQEAGSSKQDTAEGSQDTTRFQSLFSYTIFQKPYRSHRLSVQCCKWLRVQCLVA